MTVTVYSTPACVQCNSTYRKLDKHGIVYTSIDVTQDEEAYEMIKALGYSKAPVVITDDEHWSGFQPDKIEALIKPEEAVEPAA